MPRGFKVNHGYTAIARKAELFVSPQSFISMPKNGIEHLILYGQDKALFRRMLFIREKNRCQGCGKLLREDVQFPNPQAGEWSHVLNKDGERCDCIGEIKIFEGIYFVRHDNARLECHNCHQGPGSEHYKRRPQFGVKSNGGN